MPGTRCTRGLVRKRKCGVHARAYRFSGGIRHSLRDGLTAYGALSPATNSSCHRRRRIQRLLNPVGLNLSPPTWHQQRVSGPHGFAVRSNVVRPARLLNRSRGSTRPATAIARRRSRVHHIPSRVRDDARPPLLSERDGIIKAVIWVESETEYFYAGDWTTQISLKSLGNFRFACNGFLACKREPRVLPADLLVRIAGHSGL